MRKLTPSPIIRERLIESVRKRRALYDYSVVEHINQRDQLWAQISHELGVSVRDCKSMWKNLRDEFRKQAKRRGSGTKWIFYDQMSFMYDFMSLNQIDDNQVEERPYLENASNSESAAPNLSPRHEEVDESLHRKLNQNTSKQRSVALLTHTLFDRNDKIDYLDHWALGIAGQIRKFSDEKQMEVMAKISMLMYEISKK